MQPCASQWERLPSIFHNGFKVVSFTFLLEELIQTSAIHSIMCSLVVHGVSDRSTAVHNRTPSLLV